MTDAIVIATTTIQQDQKQQKEEQKEEQKGQSKGHRCIRNDHGRIGSSA